MSNNLNFKYGKHANLGTLPVSAGTIYVTTDEKAMYVDLPDAENSSKITRIRMGDIVVVDSLDDMVPPFDVGFYYIIGSKAFLRCNGKDSAGKYLWDKINSTDYVDGQIQLLGQAIDVINNTTIPDLKTEVSNEFDKVLYLDVFEQYKNQMVQQKAEIDGSIGNVQKALDDYKLLNDEEISDINDNFNNYLPLTGGTLTGDLVLDTKTITGIADLTASSADSSAANKKYVDTKAQTAENNAKAVAQGVQKALDDYKLLNDEEISDINDNFNNYLPLTGGTLTGDLVLDTKTITGIADLTASSADSSAANKKYVDDQMLAAQASVNAMTFKGAVPVGGLPEKEASNIGDTYVVTQENSGVAGSKIGDLFIFSGAADKDKNGTWNHIKAGYNLEYVQTLIKDDNDASSIILTNGVATTENSRIKFTTADDTCLKFNLTSNGSSHAVTASFTWETF